MNTLNVKKGDVVMIIAGKDKGKSGIVSGTLPSEGKVVVEGLNLSWKNKKARSAQERNERIEVPQPVAVSNVMPVCGACNKVTRVKSGVKTVEGKEKKVRVCSHCGAVIEGGSASKAKSAAKKASKKKKTEEQD